MKKNALILEGGANRGIFTSGVLDYLMEKEFYTDYVVGVSAGACNAVDYVSHQPDRSRQCIIAWNQESKREQFDSFRQEHSVMDFRSLFDTFPNRDYPFDYESYFQSETKCELTVTNCITGKAEFKSEASNRERLMKICRASSSIPVLATMVDLDGIPYLDGGLADSIPVIHARKLGYEKNIIVLTQKKGYRKTVSRKNIALIRAKFRQYPELVRTICLRPFRYNRCLEAIEKWEAAGKLFVIRPEVPPVGRLEKHMDKLEAFYQHGYQMMEKRYDEMMNYLSV